MKKKILIALLCVLFIPQPVFAFSASAKCSGPGSVTVGQSFSVTITGNASSATDWKAASPVNSSSNLRLTSDTGSSIWEDDKTSISKTYNFTALSEGTATVNQSFTVTNTDDYSSPTITSSSCTISIVKPAAPSNNSTGNKTQASINNVISNNTTNKNENLSSDNALKSLSIEGNNIEPKFDKDTLEYNVSLNADTKTIKIVTEKNDDKATVSGDGEVEVKEGRNTIQIVVTAQNGATRAYIINAYVKEHDPIIVTIDGDKYTVLKKFSDIQTPTGFEKKTMTISKTEVDSFYNEKLNYTLVALQDKIGNIELYIYNSKSEKYIKYSPIVSENLNIIVLNANENEIPHRYVKSNFLYDGKLVTGYALNESSDFRLIYAINTETGEKGFYLYDMKGKTLQRFYNDQVNIYIDLIQKIKIAFLILGGFILFLVLMIIILLLNNVKFKKKYLQKRLSKIDNPIIEDNDEIKYHDLDETTQIDMPDKKSKKKEKTFLDE